jgi:hypothetical protein
MTNLLGSGGHQVFRLPSVVELTHSLMGLEPATNTSEALVAQYLHCSYRADCILQFDSAVTGSLPKKGFLQGNPNLLPNNLARQ